MLGVTDYLVRLLPRNPILLRVVEGGGKRRRDVFIRWGYLGLLVFFVCFRLMSGVGGIQSLGDLAKNSDDLFEQMSYLQLGLVALLAPIFTAGAITQEKDAQTYDILLSTPMTNAQIVLGSLLSRVFFIVALLISGIPIFSITQIFGGVAISSIILSFAIAAATALITGAIAMAIATFKVGTRRTIFSFYLFIVIYLVGLYFLDTSPTFWIAGRNPNSHISWFTPIHPFLALRTIFVPEYAPPELGALPQNLHAWPIGWALSNPVNFYVSLMFFLSFALITPSILLLRRMAQSSNSFRSWILQKLHISKGDRTQKPRIVWSNPIAWREAKTKGSAARSTILRWTFIGAGLIGAIVLVFLFSSESTPDSYIDASFFQQGAQNLTIFGENGGPFPLDPAFRLRYKDTDVRAGELAGRLAVVGVPTVSRVPMYNPDGTRMLGPDGRPALRQQLTSLNVSDIPRKLSEKDVRWWLSAAVIIEFAVILLIVTNAAASTVTREKEDGTLDLLLSTPITSRYYIWGKLRGLVSFVLPLAAVPLLSMLILVIYDFCRMVVAHGSNFHWVIYPESVFILPGTLVMVTAFAAILGMQMSLRFRTTVWAVMSSIGIVAGICFGLGFCGYAAVSNQSLETGGLFFGAFSPFTLVSILIDPEHAAPSAFDPSGSVTGNRLALFIFGWVAAGVYAMIVWSMYKSMVKNFDMTIRKQAR